jgi:hypothetical protein
MEYQLVQAQTLGAGGFKVKNTFIDGPPAGGVVIVPRRAMSAPPMAHRCHQEAKEIQSFMVSHILEGKMACPASRPARRSAAKSIMSTTASDHSDEVDIESTDSETSPPAGLPELGFPEAVQREPCALLEALIKTECQFLLIGSCMVHSVNHELRRKPLPVGVDKCLRVFIHGLPVVRRSKWQHPLAWCVAGVLKRVGCKAFIKRGELFVAFGGSANEVVQIEFSAER